MSVRTIARDDRLHETMVDLLTIALLLYKLKNRLCQSRLERREQVVPPDNQRKLGGV